MPQFVLLRFLQEQSSCNVTDQSLLDLISKNHIDFETALEGLIAGRILYRAESEIGLLPDDLQIYISGEGKIYAGENKSGEMFHYFMKGNYQDL